MDNDIQQFLCSLVGNSENTRWSSMSVVNTVLDAMLPAVWLVDPGFLATRFRTSVVEVFFEWIYETASNKKKKSESISLGRYGQ